jgi:hypothetical protein
VFRVCISPLVKIPLSTSPAVNICGMELDWPSATALSPVIAASCSPVTVR